MGYSGIAVCDVRNPKNMGLVQEISSDKLEAKR